MCQSVFFLFSDLPSSPPTTQGESTSAVSTGDERSQKIKEIVKIYRNNTEISLPCPMDLRAGFTKIMATLASNLTSADEEKIIELHTSIRIMYCWDILGVRPTPLPDVPRTPDGLINFIAAKSSPFEILLVHHAVDELECKDLKTTLEEYEGMLAKHLKQKLLTFKSDGVTLSSHTGRTHMAIVLSKDQVFLSLILHIEEFLKDILHLEEALFEGFAEGCTILFFSILRIDAVLLSPKIISHLSELKRKFEITHLVVFGYFACDLEQASVEVLVSVNVCTHACTMCVGQKCMSLGILYSVFSPEKYQGIWGFVYEYTCTCCSLSHPQYPIPHLLIRAFIEFGLTCFIKIEFINRLSFNDHTYIILKTILNFSSRLIAI